MTFVLLGSMLVFFVIGVPIAIAMGLSAVTYMLIRGDIPLAALPHRMMSGVDNFPLLAIPFYILAGGLMNNGGVTRRLVTFSYALVGRITGGMAHVTIVANMIMAGMSGSAVADASGTGSILIPAMVRAGYPPAFATAITGAAATIGPIIPPSIPFVIVGAITEVSTGRLFLGGIVPGIAMGLFLMASAYILSKRRGYGAVPEELMVPLGRAAREALLPLLAPAIIIGGIFTGTFTPTEAAVVASVYALCLGVYYRELTWASVRQILVASVCTTSIVFFILAGSSVGGWLVALERVPQAITLFFRAMTDNPFLVLLFINILLLFLGTLMDGVPIMIILFPILMPLVRSYGIDPIHFGVMAVLNLMIGLITPPVGMVMYVVCSITKLSIHDFAREAWPFMLALILVLLLITYIPPLVTFIPDLAMGR